MFVCVNVCNAILTNKLYCGIIILHRFRRIIKILDGLMVKASKIQSAMQLRNKLVVFSNESKKMR